MEGGGVSTSTPHKKPYKLKKKLRLELQLNVIQIILFRDTVYFVCQRKRWNKTIQWRRHKWGMDARASRRDARASRMDARASRRLYVGPTYNLHTYYSFE